MIRRIARWTLLVLALVFVGIQFLPHKGSRVNPPVAQEPAWDSPRTRELFYRACGDCHSNETKWPWYSHVAPVSWTLLDDVRHGRNHLNASEWNRPQKHAHEAAEEIEEGTMPLANYLRFHPEARLSAVEKDELIRGLKATFGTEAPAH